MPPHLGTYPNARQRGTRITSLNWCPLAPPKLMPSLISATSGGWELWGKKFTRLWGLFQLLTQQKRKKKMNSTYYPV